LPHWAYTASGRGRNCFIISSTTSTFSANVIWSLALGLALYFARDYVRAVVLIAFWSFYALFSWEKIRTYKYACTHLRWGTQNFSLSTPTWKFIAADVGGLLLTILSLGLLMPFCSSYRYHMLLSELSCGRLKFRYTGNGRDLFEDYVSAFPPIAMTGGITYWWLHSKVWRYRIAHTWLGGDDIGSARGYYGVKGNEYLYLRSTGWLALAFSVGILLPYLRSRDIRYKLGRFALIGNLDLHFALPQDS
jgi:uncharacterized membrane protein YjgN (DUF898 family)